MAAAAKLGKCYTFRGLKFYAQNGFVCLHDEQTGEFFVLTRREFLQRAQALGDEAKRMRHMSADNPGMKWISTDRAELQLGIEHMVACTREAQEQGDRTDPQVDAWFMKHRPNRKSAVSMTAGANFSTKAPSLILPVGKDTGKHVAPDFTIGGKTKPKLILPGE